MGWRERERERERERKCYAEKQTKTKAFTLRGFEEKTKTKAKLSFPSSSLLPSPQFSLYPTLGLLVVRATNPALIGATVLDAPQAWHRRNMILDDESRSRSESGLLQLLQRTYSLT